MSHTHTVCYKFTDFTSKMQSLSLWTRLHVFHHWDVLSEAGDDPTGAYFLSGAQVREGECRKVRVRWTLSGTGSGDASIVRSGRIQSGQELTVSSRNSDEPRRPLGVLLQANNFGRWEIGQSVHLKMPPLCHLAVAVFQGSVLSIFSHYTFSWLQPRHYCPPSSGFLAFASMWSSRVHAPPPEGCLQVQVLPQTGSSVCVPSDS